MKKVISIKTKPAINGTNKESMFLSFNYDSDILRLVKELPKRWYIPATKEWEVPIRYIPQVADMFKSDNFVVEIVGKVVTKVEKELKSTVKFVTHDIRNFAYKTTPFDHQIQSFEYAKQHNRFLLADEQGLGKTKQAIDIAVARKHQFKHCLIICGVNSTKLNWKNEVETHSNEKAHILGSHVITRGPRKGKLDADGDTVTKLSDLKSDRKEFFLITNVETLRNDDFKKEIEKQTTAGTIGMVIIDEIHKCKNPTSTQGKAIHKVHSFYKIALTGTPLMNEPIDLYNPLKWLGEEQGGVTAFKQRYCELGGFGGYEVIGYKNLEELKNRLDKVQLRRLKSEVLNLPPKIRQVELVEMGKHQDKLYNDILDEIKMQFDELVVNPNPLAKLIRLRQVTGNPELLDKSVLESAKMERLEEIIEENAATGTKTIVFSNWQMMTMAVKKRLAKYLPAYIDGDVKDRQEQVDRFQNDEFCKVIIGTIGAMGTGLTLNKASHVIFLDIPWNMANLEQAEDRAHRIGTMGTVNVILLTAHNSIDERIYQLVLKKGKLSEALVDGKFGKLDKEETLRFLLS